jgi:hypothetical protein|tara:strand:+ start:41 stop:454 length:414 start_codon:yes stop_codon:yes gene_type:complete
MGFKLGRERGLQVSKGEITSKMRFNKDHVSMPGTPVFRKDLGEGIMGEANMDGSIYLSNNIEPGSKEEREVLVHEMRHATDMKIGKLKYEDDYIKYNGQTHARKTINGEDMIQYDGKWLEAGSTKFPWELEANNGNK